MKTGVLLFPYLHEKTGENARSFRGGAKGSRTPDLLNAIQTRYQLRYNPNCLIIIP